MQTITPFIWFDHQAEEVASFYTSIFRDGEILEIKHYGKDAREPEGTVLSVTMRLAGREFVAMNGGPYFSLTPAISFYVDCETEEEQKALWDMLSEQGIVLMDLGPYEFSESFGWVQDRYGVSWQLNLADVPQQINPFFMFIGDQHGKCEEAISFYTSTIPGSKLGTINRYKAGEEGQEGTVKLAYFILGGQEFMAMDSNLNHTFGFSPALSMLMKCKTQEEANQMFETFTRNGVQGQLGWLTDSYGVAWQIVKQNEEERR